MLSPPKEVGREALVQDQSGRGATHQIRERFENESVKGVSGLSDIGRRASSEGKGYFWEGRQDFRIVVSICESCRSGK